MHLFSHPADPTKNYLPQDGTINYHSTIIPEHAIAYYTILLNTIEWENDETVIFGKRIMT